MRIESPYARIAVALGIFAVTFGIRRVLDPLLGAQYGFMIFFPAIMIAAWVARRAGGMLVTLLAAASVLVFWPPAAGQPGAFAPAYVLHVTLFIVLGLVVAHFVGTRRNALAAVADSERSLVRLKEELENQVGDLRRLHDLSAQITGVAALEPMLHEVLRAALEVNKTTMGLLSLVNPEQGGLKVVASAGFPPDFVRQMEFIQPGEGACGLAFERRQRVVAADVHVDPAFRSLRAAAKQGGFRAVHCTPLVIRDGRIIGVLSAMFRDVHRPTDREIWLMDLYARNAADLIESTQLREQVARELEVRREAEKALVMAKAELEQRVQERTASLLEAVTQMEEFSYSVSHDLRSPIRAIVSYSQALLEDHATSLTPEARDYVDRIVRSGRRMDRLIQDILIYSRLNRERIELRRVSLNDILTELLHQNPEFQAPRANIVVRRPLVDVLAHGPSLTQAVANLLANAVKFVRPGVVPQVEVRTEQRGMLVRLEVRDNGIGVKPEHQSRLFGVFERLHPESTYQGTGIGLAIVRRAVERVGGKAGVISDGEHGSTFWIELAAAQPATEPPPANNGTANHGRLVPQG